MRRALHVLALALLVGASTAASWLLFSEAGLLWLWARVETAGAGAIGAERITGRLVGPLQAEGLVITAGGSETRVQHLDLDWRPGELLAGQVVLSRLRLQTVEVRTVVVEAAEPEPPAAGLPLPLGVVLEEATVQGLQVQGAPPVEQVQVRAALLGQRLRLDMLQVEGPWGRIAVDGRAGLAPGRRLQLNTRWSVQVPQLARPLEGHGTVGGTFEAPQLTQEITAPLRARLSGAVRWQEETPRWHLAAEAVELEVAALDAAWRPLAVAGRLGFEGAGLQGVGSGELQLTDAQFGTWRAVWEVSRPEDWVYVEQLQLSRPADGAIIELAGRVLPDFSRTLPAGYDLTLQWQNLLAPWAGREVASPWGQLHLAGDGEGYRFDGSLAAHATGVPEASLTLAGSGHREGLSLERWDGQWLAGQWQGSGEVAWAESLRWQAQLAAQGVDPARGWPVWVGDLSGRVQAAGEGRAARVTVETVTGTLRGRPLRLSAGLGVDASGAVQVEQLQLASGQARLAAEGRLDAEAVALAGTLHAPNLADLWPGLAGSLDLKGQVSGAARQPRIVLEGKAQRVASAQTLLRQAQVNADIDLAGHAPWQLEVQARGLELPDGSLVEQAGLTGTGTAGQHELALQVQSADNTLRLAATGRWAQGWQLDLGSGEWRQGQARRWQATTATFTWQPAAGLVLTPWCWDANDGGRLCLEGQRTPAGDATAAAELAEVPLALFAPWLPRPDLLLDGRLQGRLTLAASQGRLSRLDGTAEVTAGRIALELPDGRLESALRTLRVAMHGEEATGLSGEGLLELEQGGQASAVLRIPGWLPGWPRTAAQVLDGRLDLAFTDTAWVPYFFPALHQPRGRLEARLQLAGNMTEPLLGGELRLLDGAVLVPGAGLELKQIHLEATSPDGRHLAFRGGARSGPGRLEWEGRLEAATLEQWRLDLALRGEEFEVVRLPKARAIASTDLTLALTPGVALLRGSLSVPEANIQLPELPTVATASPDEIILDAAAATPAQRWRVDYDLTLAAGERVRLEGYGFSGWLGGSVQVRGEHPGTEPRLQGELHVREGRYEAYGQDLRVDQGRLLFAASPPDNPTVDARAVRPLPDVVVGVAVSGPLQQPELRLFSQPAMDESDQLAYLVLGRPLTQTSSSEADALQQAALSLGLVGGDRTAREIAQRFGIDEVRVETNGHGPQQAALVLGKYLTPRLYLQYAAGLFDAVNLLRLRYQLTSRWTVRAEQGAQSGADLLYTIER